ncbi:hypothetical protein Tco_0141853 [Tanacetum coccineum]
MNPSHHQQPLPTTHDPTPTGQSSQHSQHQEPITTTHSPIPVMPSPAVNSLTPSSSTTSTQHPPNRTHPKVTRAQVGTVKPIPRFNLHTSHISPLPKSPFIVLSDPNWCAAMYDEYNALVKNST